MLWEFWTEVHSRWTWSFYSWQLSETKKSRSRRIYSETTARHVPVWNRSDLKVAYREVLRRVDKISVTLRIVRLWHSTIYLALKNVRNTIHCIYCYNDFSFTRQEVRFTNQRQFVSSTLYWLKFGSQCLIEQIPSAHLSLIKLLY